MWCSEIALENEKKNFKLSNPRLLFSTHFDSCRHQKVFDQNQNTMCNKATIKCVKNHMTMIWKCTYPFEMKRSTWMLPITFSINWCSSISNWEKNHTNKLRLRFWNEEKHFNVAMPTWVSSLLISLASRMRFAKLLLLHSFPPKQKRDSNEVWHFNRHWPQVERNIFLFLSCVLGF